MLRMVILTTNIVESSVTIPDDDIAVDTSSHNRRNWNAGKREYELLEKPVARHLLPQSQNWNAGKREYELQEQEKPVARHLLPQSQELERGEADV